MKYEIPFRVIVRERIAGVAMAVQKGKDGLLFPTEILDSEIRFEFSVDISLTSDVPNFLGKYAQGPKNSRFVYVNSGEYAGQTDSCWARRAKLTLTIITAEQIRTISEKPEWCLQAVIPGAGPDGGPICGSVKAIEWKVREK